MRKFLLSLLTVAVALGMASTADAKPKAGPKFAKQGKFAAGLQTGLGGFGSGVGWHLMTTTTEVDGKEVGDADTSELILNPTVDYFVIDGLAIGLQPLFGMWSTETAETTTFGVGLRAHYYHLLMGSLYLFGGGTFGLATATTDVDNPGGGSTETETGVKWLDITAGGALSFGNKFGGFGTLGLNYSIKWGNPDGPTEYTESGFGIQAGLGVYF